MGLRIQLLGQFEIDRNGRSIAQTEWRTEKNKDLVKLFALYPDQVLSQDWLMESLWPDQDPARSVRNLRGRISEVRRILEPHLSQGSQSTYVKTVANGYTLDARRCRIDAEVFQRCYRQAVARAELDAGPAIRSFKRALPIYRDDLLPSDRHKEWTLQRREELRRLYLDALRQLTDLLYRDCQYDEAIRYGEQALQADPFDERIYRTLMRAHHEMGNAHGALQLYERCRRTLAEAATAPSDATEHLFETLRQQAYRFAENADMMEKLRSIDTQLESASEPKERWDLLGRKIDQLHALGRGDQEAEALDAAEVLARDLDESGMLGRVLIKRSRHHRIAGQQDAAERCARLAHEQFDRAGDPVGMAEAHAELGRRCLASGARDGARDGARQHFEHALELVRLVDGVRADGVRVRLWTQLGRLACHDHRYEGAQAYYDHALRVSRAIDDYAQQARLYLRLGALAYYRDLTAQAGVHWEQGRDLGRRIGHREIEAKCLANLAVLKKNEAELTSAWGLCETAIQIQGRLDDVAGLAKNWNNLGLIQDALGQPTRALDAFERARQHSEAAGDTLGVAVEAMNVASVQIRQGRVEEAEARLTWALESFRAHDNAWYEAQALYYRGELDRARSLPLRSKDWFDRALQRVHPIGSRKLAEHLRAALAVVALDLDRGKHALEWAQAVEATLAETPPGIDDARVLYRLYRVYRDAEMDERAQRHLRKAHELVSQLAASLTDPTDRESFHQVPLYRRIVNANRQRSDRNAVD